MATATKGTMPNAITPTVQGDEPPWMLFLKEGLSLQLLCLVQVGNGIELDTVGRQFEPYRRHPCGVTWDVVPEQSW